ncbi:MAG: sulfur carrier protein ThiS, partial [Phocaeicola sp.]
MNILINNKESEVEAQTTVAQLASQLALPDKGVAIAINNQMVPRATWEERMLQPADSLVIIQAAC